MFTVRALPALAIAAIVNLLFPLASAFGGSGHANFQTRAPFQFASGPSQFRQLPQSRQFAPNLKLASQHSGSKKPYKDNYEVSPQPTSIGSYSGGGYQNVSYSSSTSSYSAVAYQSSGNGNYTCVVVNVGHCSVTGPPNAASGTPCFCGQYHGLTR
jgi:hypothetical protein